MKTTIKENGDTNMQPYTKEVPTQEGYYEVRFPINERKNARRQNSILRFFKQDGEMYAGNESNSIPLSSFPPQVDWRPFATNGKRVGIMDEIFRDLSASPAATGEE